MKRITSKKNTILMSAFRIQRTRGVFWTWSGVTRVGAMKAASHIFVVNATRGERTRLVQAKSRGAQFVRAKIFWDPEDTVLARVLHPSDACEDLETPRSAQIRLWGLKSDMEA
ncbi:unnamed protein product [Strongylus vulgaris]|uniref:Uncharacterized protein n=1 Tax=Strongylus vulgaris TaxID=40348 RepID=A0A3P7J5L7_STRVU|nr:unnamed protein product [Strongylus vulgaris]